MNNNNIYFKKNIYKIKRDETSEKQQEIIFRVISFNDMYFYAQEILTGCIFPVFNYNVIYSTTKENKTFREYSYLASGLYYVFFPLIGSYEIFKYELDNKDEDFNSLDIVSVDEINLYLRQKKENIVWKNQIQEMESKNKYMCDINLIKEKITMLRDSESVLDIDFNKVKPQCVKYVSNIDLKEIKEFGYDLSTQDNLCNLIGREDEKKKIIKAVAIRNKSVILIGEPGSGKTSIPESLALDIKNKRNIWLNDRVIFYFDTARLVAGTKYRGDFENKFIKIINFCKEHKDRIILFIDEIHTLYGLGRTADSTIDAMNILKTYITKGELTIIGATTEKEYNEYMANDPAFLRRFEEVKVSVPDKSMNVEIILSYINTLENKYKIKLDLDEDTIRKIVEFIIDITEPKNQNAIGISKIVNPTISKNIIEDAFTEAVYNSQKVVTIDDICFAILSCDKFSPTYRKTVAEKLKNKITTMAKSGPKEIIKFENKKLALIK